MTYTYKTKGTCSTQIDLELEGNIVHNVKFTGGCNGNLQAIPKLVEGLTVEQVEALFKSVGWESAQWPERLFKALQHSDTVISAWDGGHLVGLVRVLDDTEMVAYMHWVLVDPAYHGQHIGSHLVELVKAKYRDYFLLEVMPEESKNAPFYQKHGFHLMDDGRAMQIVNRG